MVVYRFFNDGKLLLIEHIQMDENGQAVKVYEEYLTREEAQKFAKRVMFEANVKLKSGEEKAKVEDSDPLPPQS